MYVHIYIYNVFIHYYMFPEYRILHLLCGRNPGTQVGGRSSRTCPQVESGDWTPNVILIVLLVASMYIYPELVSQDVEGTFYKKPHIF